MGTETNHSFGEQKDTEWAHAFAGGLSARGAEGTFADLTANVHEAEITKKSFTCIDETLSTENG